MRRAPLVIGATGVGLGLLFSFHTKPLHVSISAASGGAGTPGSSRTTPTTEGGPGSTSTGSTTTGPTSTGPTAPSGAGTTVPAPSTTAPAAATRSATGPDIPYRYGDLQLRVTEKGSTITKIQILSDGAADSRSAEINSQALPLLQQEAMSAQSANIDGVSGATYTSAAYAQALQSALDQMGA
jgi:uncharacterized protein with FMN-binding domain